jgi:hypothetical protein
MQQNADVVPRDADFAAHIVFLPLFQEDCSQNGAVARRQSFKHLAHYPARVIGDNATQGVWFASSETIRGLIIEGLHSTGGAKMLRQHVIANGVDQGPQALGIADAALASQQLQATGEGLLLHILDGLSGSQPGA